MSTAKTATKAPAENQSVIKLKPIRVARISFGIIGTSPLIQHAWSEKVRKMLRDKSVDGKKTKDRSIRDAKSEAVSCSYRLPDGRYGVPLRAIKAAMVGAAHKDIGIEKTLVRKGLFFPPHPDGQELVPFTTHSDPVIREDFVRVGQGSADLRYRLEFREWAINLDCEYDAALLTPDTILTLTELAGFGVGICEWRPEKNGDNGRFKVDRLIPAENQR